MLKLKLQYFGHLMWRADSLEKTLMLGKTEGRRRRGWQKMRKLDGINSVDVSLSKLWKMVKDGKPGVLQSMGLQRVGHDWATEQQQQRHILYSQKPKAMVFLVVMYGCESWSIKKAKCQRIDASELWCWRRLFRVPWTARRSNQSILKEIQPDYALERLMLKLQYSGH